MSFLNQNFNQLKNQANSEIFFAIFELTAIFTKTISISTESTEFVLYTVGFGASVHLIEKFVGILSCFIEEASLSNIF